MSEKATFGNRFLKNIFMLPPPRPIIKIFASRSTPPDSVNEETPNGAVNITATYWK